MKYQRLSGPLPVIHNRFSAWMAERNISVRKLASIVGCSPRVINDLRHGRRRMGRTVRRLLMIYYPDCPVTPLSLQTYKQPHPCPAAKGPPNYLKLSPLAKLATSLGSRSAEKKKALG